MIRRYVSKAARDRKHARNIHDRGPASRLVQRIRRRLHAEERSRAIDRVDQVPLFERLLLDGVDLASYSGCTLVKNVSGMS